MVKIESGQNQLEALAMGAMLQCMEAFTLGMPFEVWKTHQISQLAKGHRESAVESFLFIYRRGGLGKFYHGTAAKLLESATKGGILLWATDVTLSLLPQVNIDPKSSVGGMIGGFCGGVAQTITMAPLTHVVTYKNRNPLEKNKSWITVLREQGIKTAYASAPAVAARQGTNWALRWYFAKVIEGLIRKAEGKSATEPLGKIEQVIAGLLGGCIACVNQPFEVARVTVQAHHATGNRSATVGSGLREVYKKYGVAGLYCGVIPRMGLGAWQTLFMVTFSSMIKEQLKEMKERMHSEKK